MSNPSPRDWLLPRLTTLVVEAEAAGIARDISVALITDMINGPLAAPVPPPTGENPNKDQGEPDYMADEYSGAHPSLPEEPNEGAIPGQNLGRLRSRWR